MRTKRLKKFVVPSVYMFSLIAVTLFVIAAGKGINSFMEKKKDNNTSSETAPETREVQAEEAKIIKPYTDTKVKIGKSYYDYTGEQNDQEKSIYYYENTYMQNSGVDYTNDKPFDAVATLEGEVINIKKDSTLGNIVEVKHENDIITVYQGLEKVNVKKEQQIKQGDVIGTSGASKINPEFKNYLHFEVYYKGTILNPEEFYKLKLNDLDKAKGSNSEVEPEEDTNEDNQTQNQEQTQDQNQPQE